mgnify:CR=1 FL=1
MTKYSILGSCVTRDIFSAMEKDSLIGDYRARTSLHTIFKNPVPEGLFPDTSGIESNWQRRMVDFELSKKSMDVSQSEYLIVDFIDERFHKGYLLGTMISISDQMSKKVVPNYDVVSAFKQGTSRDIKHWTGVCKLFANWVKVEGVKVILHSSRFAKSHLDGDKLVDNPKQEFIEKMNKIIRRYEKIFLEEVPVDGVVQVSKKHLVSDPNHVWGLAPFHYVAGYYENAWEQIVDISD